MSLTEIFENEKIEKLTKDQQLKIYRKEYWSRHLKCALEIFENLAFLKEKGYKIEILYNTPFNEKLAVKKFYPNVRVNGKIMIEKVIFGDPNMVVSGGVKFAANGEQHTYETFLKKLIN